MASAPLVSSRPDDNGAAIVVVTFVLLVLTVCFAILRIYTTFRRKRAFGLDDAAIIAATTILTSQSIVVERSVSQGLGSHITTLSSSQSGNSYEWIYASQLLGIVAEFLAKISMVALIGRLDSQTSTRVLCRLTSFFVLAWSLFSFFTIAFQCHLPNPWNFSTERCAAGGKLWYAILAGDAASDLFLAVSFLSVLWKLRMRASVRFSTSALIILRILVCGALAGHMFELDSYLSSSDKTWFNTLPTIFFQVTINLSVITAAVPSLHRYISDLSTGHLGSILSEHELEVTAFNTRFTRADIAKPVPTSKTTSKISSRMSMQLSNGTRAIFIERCGPARRPSTPRSDERPLRLIPDLQHEYQAHIYATPPPSRARSLTRKASSVFRRTSEDETPPEEAFENVDLGKIAVYTTKEFTLEVEYDPERLNSPRDQYYGQYTRDETLHSRGPSS